MHATVNLPDSIYDKAKALAASRGITVEQMIIGAVANAVEDTFEQGTPGIYGDREIKLPVIRSSHPGTLDLSSMDFDDLLA